MKLALFDLDNTLLSGDTDVEWLDFLVERGVLPASEGAANHAMDRRYGSGKASPLEYVRFYLSYYRPYDLATLRAWRAEFFERRIRPLMLPAAGALIDSHRKSLIAIVTATNRFLVEPIAAAFGIEHLMATEPQIADGRFTGDIVAEPCMREGKVAHLARWLGARGHTLEDFGESWFYSDSINDLPLLERVTHPVAVDPGEKLEALARSRGWPRITLRAAPAARGGPSPT
jgi:HAD superfamily hydrolase (TIGR01490 family)